MKFSILNAILLLISHVYAAPTPTTSAATPTGSYIPQKSPVFPSSLPAATDVVTSYPVGPYNLTDTLPTYTLQGYPTTWEIPDVTHPEVVAAINAIDWSLVPKAPVRQADADGNVLSPKSDGAGDPWCYWSDTGCVNPKVNVPADLHGCNNQKDWGLTYDDGPFNIYDDQYASLENPYAEPALYNFLAKTNNQKATMFYIGSNIVNYPAAAKRGFNDGHQICVHTYSHHVVTTLSNEQIVAELYWTLKAIKETVGVTSKCWRPPQGDVDDRVRSIAWQMGLQNVLWDRDSNDWNIKTMGAGSLTPETVDGYFQGWVADEQSGKDTAGHIVLEHELNDQTVSMAEKWLPIIQKDFNVIPALSCNGLTQPYWETNMVYPLTNQPVGGGSNSTISTTSNT